MKALCLILAVALLAAPGCKAMMDHPEYPIIGAIVGAIAGHQFDHEKGRYVGAAVGLAIGAAVAYNEQLDDEAAALEVRTERAKKAADGLESYNETARAEVEETAEKVAELRRLRGLSRDWVESRNELAAKIAEEIRRDEVLIADVERAIHQLEISAEDPGERTEEKTEADREAERRLVTQVERLRQQHLVLLGVKEDLQGHHTEITGWR